MLTRKQLLQNQTLITNAATSIGCGVTNLVPEQLLQAHLNQQVVLQLIWNLTRTELFARCSMIAPSV